MSERMNEAYQAGDVQASIDEIEQSTLAAQELVDCLVEETQARVIAYNAMVRQKIDNGLISSGSTNK